MKKYVILLAVVILGSCKNKPNKEVIITDKYMENTISIGAKVIYGEANKINRNDIVVFKDPSQNKLSCLRIVGMPGEKIEIIRGLIFINGKEYHFPESSKMIYTVYSKINDNFSVLADYDFKNYNANYGMVYVTKKQVDEIKAKKLVDSIYPLGFDSFTVLPEIVRVSTSKYSNPYYFGPVIIPNIGDTIFKKDEMLIFHFSKFDNDYQIVDDNFYFCIGDGFSDARDSRQLGLIPKERIVGRVTHIDNITVINVDVPQ